MKPHRVSGAPALAKFAYPPMLNSKVIIRLPALIIAGGIWVLSSQSTLPQPKGILGFDKFQHLVAYLALAAAVGGWISSAFWQSRPFLAFLAAAVLASIYGVVDEIHQYFTPARDCDVWDWVADTLGAVFGAAVMMRVNSCLLNKIKDRLGEAA